MARAMGVTRLGHEKKGEMASRSTDVYLHKEGTKEVAVCTACRSFYMNKRWHLKEDAVTKQGGKIARSDVLCPACQRMRDDNPAGIATFSGNYLVEHEDDILNTIKNVEVKARAKNALARIMEIGQEKNVLTVRTTDEKLAEKLGKEIYKAHSGRLALQWSREESFVRVNWNR
jgi:hypothetical protein